MQGVEGTTFFKKSNNLSLVPSMPANLQNMPCGSAQCTQDHQVWIQNIIALQEPR
jgi:hypothetical protein